jgi:hypothetical protein
MKTLSKFLVLGAVAVFAASTSFAFADEIDLSGPGTFTGGIYIPGVAIPPTSQFDVTLETGIFTTFFDATPIFYTFNDAATPTGNFFSVENLTHTETLTFKATSEEILNATQILFTGELFENGLALSTATMGFSENPLGTSVTEDAISITPAPEPASLLLLGTALTGMAIVYLRKQLPTV